MPDPRSILTRDTLLPISIVGALLASAFVIGGDRQRIDARLARIEVLLIEIQNRSMTRHDFHVWRSELRAMNPELRIPKLPNESED